LDFSFLPVISYLLAVGLDTTKEQAIEDTLNLQPPLLATANGQQGASRKRRAR